MLKKIIFIILPVLILQAAEVVDLKYIGTTKGPFKGTSIEKYKDSANGVVCYLYIPDTVGTQTSIDDSKTYTKITTFGGNISCVKEKTGLFGLW